MTVTDVKGCLTYKDKNGDLYRMYPETKKECVDGLEYVDEHVVNLDNPHKVGCAQIGAIPIELIASLDEVLEYLSE